MHLQGCVCPLLFLGRKKHYCSHSRYGLKLASWRTLTVGLSSGWRREESEAKERRL